MQETAVIHALRGEEGAIGQAEFALATARIESVAQAVSQQVKRQHDQRNHQARKHNCPGS